MNPQSLNRYSYAINNPFIYTDPTGHEYDMGDMDFGNYDFGDFGSSDDINYGYAGYSTPDTNLDYPSFSNSFVSSNTSYAFSSFEASGYSLNTPHYIPQAVGTPVTPSAVMNDFADVTYDDIGWVARTLYGEFSSYKDIYQQTTAWIIVNRFDASDYDTYQEVVTKPYAFSCFLSTDPNYNRTMNPNVDDPNWSRAVQNATTVLYSPRSSNPIPGITNYYSPRSMNPQGSVPPWAKGRDTVNINGINPWYMTIVK